MCGIAGYIGHGTVDRDTVGRTLSSMKNRGPDHQAWRELEVDNVNVYLLHSRLSIIDVDERAHQPLEIEGYILSFNGEIYNFVELRKSLLKAGHKFRTNSDTEVLLRCYLEYGQECVGKLEGMWAFAIWDPIKRSLFLSRDRFAEKPLYVHQTPQGIFFGSETRFVRKLANKYFSKSENQILRFLILGYKSLSKVGDTFYAGISEVPYATNITIDSRLRMQTERYWDAPVYERSAEIDVSEAIEHARSLLVDSMRLRLRSDVPVAFCLSGGVDSGSLASIAAKLLSVPVTTFSIIDSDKRYDETENIDAVVRDLGCQSFRVQLNPDGALSRLKKLVRYHDAPVATISYFAHSMLSEQISDRGYRVAFSGTSADEIFSGYYDHFLLHLNHVSGKSSYQRHLAGWRSRVLPSVRNPILRNPKLYSEDPDYRAHVYDNSGEFREFAAVPFREEFAERLFTKDLMRNRMLNELFHEATPLILRQDDLNSMYYSIENRSPYLDSRLVEFMSSVPSEMLIQEGTGKYILREAMNGILNEKVRTDHTKKGFNASIKSLFDLSSEAVRECLVGGQSPLFELVNRAKIERLLDLKEFPNHYSKFLFSVLSSRIFLDEVG